MILSLGSIIFADRLGKDTGASCNVTSDCSPGLSCYSGKCLCTPDTSCNNDADCGGVTSRCISGVCKAVNNVIDVDN